MDRQEQLQQWREESGYSSVDPAPPEAPRGRTRDIHALRARLLDTSLPMFQRMRAVFALRNQGGEEAVEALAAAFGDGSALLRHEIAYVLGQMQDTHALPYLTRVLEAKSEHVMVRHEAAEALGAIGAPESVPVLQRFLKDRHPEVAQSCEVALDLIEWVRSDELEYAAW